MGTLAAALAVLGLPAGSIAAHFARSELADGKRYFLLLQHALLATILGIILWQYNTIAALVAGIAFFLALWKFSGNHSLLPTALVLGALASIFSIELLAFLYFIPTGTLHYKQYKQLFFASALYLIGLAAATLF